MIDEIGVVCKRSLDRGTPTEYASRDMVAIERLPTSQALSQKTRNGISCAPQVNQKCKSNLAILHESKNSLANCRETPNVTLDDTPPVMSFILECGTKMNW